MEQRTAAQHCGYTWSEYNELPGDPWYKRPDQADSKAEVLAFYRLSMAMKNIEDSIR